MNGRYLLLRIVNCGGEVLENIKGVLYLHIWSDTRSSRYSLNFCNFVELFVESHKMVINKGYITSVNGDIVLVADIQYQNRPNFSAIIL